jgi:hypothetical protein
MRGRGSNLAKGEIELAVFPLEEGKILWNKFPESAMREPLNPLKGV